VRVAVVDAAAAALARMKRRHRNLARSDGLLSRFYWSLQLEIGGLTAAGRTQQING